VTAAEIIRDVEATARWEQNAGAGDITAKALAVVERGRVHAGPDLGIAYNPAHADRLVAAAGLAVERGGDDVEAFVVDAGQPADRRMGVRIPVWLPAPVVEFHLIHHALTFLASDLMPFRSGRIAAVWCIMGRPEE
jgi:hypothetical protein